MNENWIGAVQPGEAERAVVRDQHSPIHREQRFRLLVAQQFLEIRVHQLGDEHQPVRIACAGALQCGACREVRRRARVHEKDCATSAPDRRTM